MKLIKEQKFPCPGCGRVVRFKEESLSLAVNWLSETFTCPYLFKTQEQFHCLSLSDLTPFP